MKKFFSVLLSIIFALSLLFTLLLSVVRFNFSYSTITDLAGQLLRPVSKAPSIEYHNDGLFHPGDAVITLASSNDDLADMDINEMVKKYLKENNVDMEPEVLADIISSPEVSQAVDKYAGEIVNYVTGESAELNIDPAEITNIVNVAIDKYEEATGDKVDRTGLEEEVAKSVNEVIPELTAALDEAKQENAESLDALKKVNTLLSVKVFVICIVVTVIFALIILLINRNVFTWFKYISIPMIVDGVILLACGIAAGSIVPVALNDAIKEFSLPGAVYDVLLGYIKKILAQINIYGIITAVLGVALCITGCVAGKKNKV